MASEAMDGLPSTPSTQSSPAAFLVYCPAGREAMGALPSHLRTGCAGLHGGSSARLASSTPAFLAARLPFRGTNIFLADVRNIRMPNVLLVGLRQSGQGEGLEACMRFPAVMR